MAGRDKRIALVTGANKGIGFEISRQLAKLGHRVIMGSRDARRGNKAVTELKNDGLDVAPVQLDVTDDHSVQMAIAGIIESEGRIDALINNAGILIDWEQSAETLKLDNVRKTLEPNFYGVLRLVQAVLPHMKKSGYGRIVNLSSTMGSLSYNSGGGGSSAPAYRLSKTALNGITAIYASDLKGSDVKINSMCPGWVRTDMGGSNATRSTEEGADTAVFLATLPADGPNGGFFKDRELMDW